MTEGAVTAPTADKDATTGGGWSARLLRHARSREGSLAITIIILVVLFGVTQPRFATGQNFLAIGRNISEIGILAIGMTIVLIVGQVDLSMGAVYSLGGITAGFVAIDTHNALLAVGAALGVGLAVGLINGLLVAFLRLNSFMATLATLNIILGLNLVWTNGLIVDLTSARLPEPVFQFIRSLGGGSVLGMDSELFFYLLLTVLGMALLRYSVLGYRLYAVGDNRVAARIAGISPALVTLVAFLISGALGALTGFLALGFVGSITPTAGVSLTFDVFAAAIIGGASLTGGRGSLVGALLGAVLLGVVSNGLIIIGLQSTYQDLVVGVVILVAITLDRFTRRGAGKAVFE